MCGIVGVLSLRPDGLWRSEVECIKDLLVADVLRGWDATGIAWMDKDSTVWTLKRAVPAPMFIDDIDVDDVAGARFVIGHNRAATVGAADDHEKAHPFSVGGVTGVHNGTLRSWRYDLSGLAPNAEMDSEALIEALSNTNESPEAVGDLLGKKVGAAGAYSLVWHDERVGALRFARNHDRPMSFLVTTGAVWYASERMMLEWILARRKYTLKEGWFSKPKQLITLPLDGSPVTVHSYQNVYPNHSYASSTYVTPYRAAGIYHTGPSGSRFTLSNDVVSESWPKPTSFGPPWVTLSHAQYLPATLSDLSSVERGAIYREAEKFVGGPMYTQKISGATLGELMAVNLTGSKDVWCEEGTAHVSFTATEGFVPPILRTNPDYTDITFVGYVTRDGVKYPAIMMGEDMEKDTAIAIQLVLDQGRFAHVPVCRVEGLRIYSLGNKIAYVLSDATVDPFDQIKAGAPKQGNPLSVATTAEFLWRHPEVVLGSGTPGGDPVSELSRHSWLGWQPKTVGDVLSLYKTH